MAYHPWGTCIQEHLDVLARSSHVVGLCSLEDKEACRFRRLPQLNTPRMEPSKLPSLAHSLSPTVDSLETQRDKLSSDADSIWAAVSINARDCNVADARTSSLELRDAKEKPSSVLHPSPRTVEIRLLGARHAGTLFSFTACRVILEMLIGAFESMYAGWERGWLVHVWLHHVEGYVYY